MRWRVERCGSRSSGYAPGWIVMDPEAERGALFTNHAEAIAFAQRQARFELERDGRRALMKLTSRGVKAAGSGPVAAEPAPAPKPAPKPRRREYHRVSDTQLRAATAMRENGHSWREISEAVGAKETTIYLAVKRAGGTR